MASGRRLVESTLTLEDGAAIFFRAWLPADRSADRAVILFHRGHEHSGRFIDVVDRMCPDGVAVFAWDARGHGRSSGPRGWAPSFMTYVRDADAWIRHLSEEHSIPVENMAVVGHSVGAVIAATWVHDFAPPLRNLTLLAPAFRVRLYLPLAIPALRLLLKIRGSTKSFVKSYVRAGMLTGDEAQAKRYAADPLISRQIAVNVLIGLHDTATRLLRDAGAFRVPTLILAAGADWVVRTKPQRVFHDGLTRGQHTFAELAGLRHDLLHEREPQRSDLLARVRSFLDETLGPGATVAASPFPAAASSTDDLRQPLPLWSPKRWSFGAMGLGMRTIGRLSEGVRLGWSRGFDSGASLDYVYENIARGRTPLGRFIDRVYLDSAGWRGIRQRRINVETLIRRAVLEIAGQGRPARLLDIATGQGRYILHAMTALKAEGARVTAVLRDIDPHNVERAAQQAAALGLADSVTCEVGDAFDESALSRLAPRPDIALVSGLYELFSDNDLVMRSLRGVAASISTGGLLIYTNQPWHPQLEFIARVLTSHRGGPWIMRCRSQAEMDGLVQHAGFRKIDMLLDDQGIFTVSLARRV